MVQKIILKMLLNKTKYSLYIIITILVLVVIIQRIQILKSEDKILHLNKQIQNLKFKIKIKDDNIKTLDNIIKNKEAFISELQKQLNKEKNTCQALLKEKDKLIHNLKAINTKHNNVSQSNKNNNQQKQKVITKVIYKTNCKIKVEENVNEKDFLYNILSNIGE